jgi:DNA primase
MMIPLMDGSGQPIGFTGRIIGDVENAPKYLNTPQTLLYDKGRHIFALAQAKEAIRTRGYVVVVEGNLDVVSSHQASVNQTVATAGTAMTEHHLKALKRLSADVRLAYDGDSAGIAATERAIAIASQLGIELTIISLPDGAKDPDELIQKDPSAWQRAIDDARPAVDWILDQYSGRVDMKSASGKRTFTSAGLGLVAQLHDPVEREHYERIIAEMTGSTLEAVREKMKQNSTEPTALRTVQTSTDTAVNDKDFVTQDNALAVAAVDAPSQELFGQMNLDMLEGPARQALGRYFARNPGNVLTDTPDELQEFDEYVKIVLLRAEARYADWSDQDRFYETARLIRQIENEYKKHKRDQLTNELRDTEAAHDDERADELRRELNQLIKEIARGR